MIIESIDLKNFRNYSSLSLVLDDKTNIFFGDNAQGKTNILESVYLCGTTRSHRSSKDREIIKFGEDESHIRMNIKKNNISYRIDMHLKKNASKGIAINGLAIKKAKQLYGLVNLVFFSPEDLSIIKNGPNERRKFMDFELCQLDKVYLSSLLAYQRILNQRNIFLKDKINSKDMFDVWDEQITIYALEIIKRRREFIDELSDIVKGIHDELTGFNERISITYTPNTDESCFLDALRKSRDRDIRYKTTTIGPHRDDFVISSNDIELRRFGSQGQQRTAALSLKLSEIVLAKKRTGDSPVLLLDDVLSELDKNRQNYLLDNIKDTQTLITCTGLDEFVGNRFTMNRIFKVTEGKVLLQL